MVDYSPSACEGAAGRAGGLSVEPVRVRRDAPTPCEGGPGPRRTLHIGRHSYSSPRLSSRDKVSADAGNCGMARTTSLLHVGVVEGEQEEQSVGNDFPERRSWTDERDYAWCGGVRGPVLAEFVLLRYLYPDLPAI